MSLEGNIELMASHCRKAQLKQKTQMKTKWGQKKKNKNTHKQNNNNRRVEFNRNTLCRTNKNHLSSRFHLNYSLCSSFFFPPSPLFLLRTLFLPNVLRVCVCVCARDVLTVDNSFQFDATRDLLRELDVNDIVWIGLMRPQNSDRFMWS